MRHVLPSLGQRLLPLPGPALPPSLSLLCSVADDFSHTSRPLGAPSLVFLSFSSPRDAWVELWPQDLSANSPCAGAPALRCSLNPSEPLELLGTAGCGSETQRCVAGSSRP
eukprot:1873354-Rhodomonas_salina.4